MKTPNQTHLREFIYRMLKPITRAISLAQSLAVMLTALAATAQTTPVATATNATVSTAEVTAFMQSFQQDPNTAFKISPNPKRVAAASFSSFFGARCATCGRPLVTRATGLSTSRNLEWKSDWKNCKLLPKGL